MENELIGDLSGVKTTYLNQCEYDIKGVNAHYADGSIVFVENNGEVPLSSGGFELTELKQVGEKWK